MEQLWNMWSSLLWLTGLFHWVLQGIWGSIAAQSLHLEHTSFLISPTVRGAFLSLCSAAATIWPL